MFFSLKKQRQDEERITLTYTRSHIVKLVITLFNLLVSLIILIVDMIDAYVPYIIENTIYTFIWMFSIMLLRREFLKIGQTSCALMGLWLFLLITPLITNLLSTVSDAPLIPARIYLSYIQAANNFLIIIVTLIRRVDIGDIYSRTSSVYNQIMKSYFLEDESIEDPDKIWDKWDKVADESIPLIERENIKKIVVKDTDCKGKVYYYNIEVSYGKTKDLTRIVPRRFREFIIFFIDLKSANPTVEFKEFPKILPNKNLLTPAAVSQRTQYFNELFSLIMKNKLNSPLFSKFFSGKNTSEVANPSPRLRTYSCIHEIPFDVQINKAFRKQSKFVTKANYEVTVKSGGFCVKTFRLFSDFKDLRKALVKRHKQIEDLPSSNILKSSANPEVVKERKIKLRSFLQKVLEDPEIKDDQNLTDFLNLDKIYFSDILDP